MFVLSVNLSYAGDEFIGTAKENKPGKIRITADSLITDSNAEYAEFVGNVRAVQGTTEITTDRLKIYYKKSLNNENKASVKEESIKRITAAGNVVIKIDNKIAKSQKAVYITKTRVLVLSGSSEVISGNDSVSGEKITIYRASGRVTVESSGKKRVEAVFSPRNKGIY